MFILTHMRAHVDQENNQSKINQELSDNLKIISGTAEDLIRIEL